MKVLFISNLFPNAAEPSRGIFNYYQIQHLAKLSEVRVVAPVARFPILGRRTLQTLAPQQEKQDGIIVDHPRHFYLPKVARQFNDRFFANGIRSTLVAIYREFPFDVIFANWTFPDACGVARLATKFNVPFVASVSGSDAHIYLNYRLRAPQILTMFRQAAAVTTRSQDLKNMLLAHGVPPPKVHVVYNGVDASVFAAGDKERARTRLGWDSRQQVLLFVGRLSPEKGVADLLAGLAHARQYYDVAARLVIVGDGPERLRLERLTIQLGLQTVVTWEGWKKPTEIGIYMNAADFLCLPSHNEGVANVVLEACSCGLPVVATDVGGIAEVLTEVTGVLASPRQPESYAKALSRAMKRNWDVEAIRRQAIHFSWSTNAEHVHVILSQAVKEYRHSPAAAT